MFFDSKFSILKAYIASLKINLEYIAFYFIWEIIVWILGFAAMIYLAISMDILDPWALTQNYTIVFKYFSKLFADLSIQKAQESVSFSGHEPYDIFKLLFPENILNHTLDGVSWSEYFNVILISKKITLSLSSIFISVIAMTIAVGYIKTALKFQSENKASLHDMYQHFYLVPQYFFGKIVIVAVCSFSLIPLLLPANLGALKQISIFVAIVGSIFMYQRLRFIQYFIIDKAMSVVAASQASWKLTQGTFFHLFIYSIASSLLFTHSGSVILLMLFRLVDKQVDVNIYKQMTE